MTAPELLCYFSSFLISLILPLLLPLLHRAATQIPPPVLVLKVRFVSPYSTESSWAPPSAAAGCAGRPEIAAALVFGSTLHPSEEAARRCSATSSSRRPDAWVCCSTGLDWSVSSPSRPWFWSGEIFFHPCLAYCRSLHEATCWKQSSSRDRDRCTWEVKMKRLLYCLACVFHTLILNQIGESINTCWYSVLDFSFALYVLYLHIVPELEHELIENFSIVFCLMVDHKSFSWVTFCVRVMNIMQCSWLIK
jgi:hypothetical protein